MSGRFARAVYQRSEPGDCLLGLSALRGHLLQSCRRIFIGWVREIGRAEAEALWRDNFGDEDYPDEDRG